jgi:hypothetical protein
VIAPSLPESQARQTGLLSATGDRTISVAAVAVLAFVAGLLAAAQWVRLHGGQAAGDRVFELRVYHTVSGRLPALHANFRDTNIRFLKKHGIESIGYWTPQDPPDSGNTLIFLLAHDSREAAARHWKEFRDDPEWQEMARASRAGGEIIERVESTFLTPADYSPLK